MDGASPAGAAELAHARALLLPRSRRLLAAFSDERLVDRLRRGDDIAFEVLYDRHHRGVLSFCRHLLGSVEEAEDAVQHAFTAAYTSLHADDREISFKAWLYTIARNRCISALRARREQPAELEDRPGATLSSEVEQRDELRALLGDLGDLPEAQRTALVLTELGDLSHAEVADVIGCEALKVKSLVFQARSALIDRRRARETPCQEIQEELATARGGSLRRGHLRRHLAVCPACAEFRTEVRRQRSLLAIGLPVLPSLALKESVLGAVGVGGVVSGGALGGAAAGFGAKAGAAKVAAALAAGTAAVGGGTVVVEQVRDETPAPVVRPAAPVQRPEAPGRTAPAAPAAVDPRSGSEAAREPGGTSRPAETGRDNGPAGEPGERRLEGGDHLRGPQPGGRSGPNRGDGRLGGGPGGRSGRDDLRSGREGAGPPDAGRSGSRRLQPFGAPRTGMRPEMPLAPRAQRPSGRNGPAGGLPTFAHR